MDIQPGQTGRVSLLPAPQPASHIHPHFDHYTEWSPFDHTPPGAVHNHGSDAIMATQAKDALERATRNLMSLDSPKYSSQHAYTGPYHPPQPIRAHTFPSAGLHPNSQYTAYGLPPPPPIHHEQPIPPSQLHYAPPPSSAGSSPSTHDGSISPSMKRNNIVLTEAPSPKAPKRARLSPQTIQIGQQPIPSTSHGVTTIPIPAAPPSSTATRKPVRPSSSHSRRSTNAATKPNLLTTSQKKANHIQSEQKRRAHIRRGYEALCEIVPALRDAIRAEDEADRDRDEDTIPRDTKGKRRSSLKEGEKVDGRQGPRSEAVVLQKTIEHVTALRTRHASYLTRLHTLRSLLPTNHPALSPLPIPATTVGARREPFIGPAAVDESYPLEFDARPYEMPVWERAWDGGTGLPIPGMGWRKGDRSGEEYDEGDDSDED